MDVFIRFNIQNWKDGKRRFSVGAPLPRSTVDGYKLDTSQRQGCSQGLSVKGHGRLRAMRQQYTSQFSRQSVELRPYLYL
jgi:hypothetical protein